MDKQKNGESIYTQYKSQADDVTLLRILDMVNQSPEVSQRKITVQTGLATGLVHSLMRKIINKGWVKAKKVSARRWLYYLTPEGFTEKSRLTLNYLSLTIKSFRDAQRMVVEQLETCMEKEYRSIAIAGESDLAEIAALNLNSHPTLTLSGVVGENRVGEKLGNETILPFEAIDTLECDCVLVCDSGFLVWFTRHEREVSKPCVTINYS